MHLLGKDSLTLKIRCIQSHCACKSHNILSHLSESVPHITSVFFNVRLRHNWGFILLQNNKRKKLTIKIKSTHQPMSTLRLSALKSSTILLRFAGRHENLQITCMEDLDCLFTLTVLQVTPHATSTDKDTNRGQNYKKVIHNHLCSTNE